MAKLLITGFDPFAGEIINPSWKAVRHLNNTIIGGFEVIAHEIPTVFGKASAIVQSQIEHHQPSVVIGVGQAGGSNAIRMECLAKNRINARKQDNEGNQPKNALIAIEGPASYPASIPVENMVEQIKTEGISAYLSNSAGAFVCNELFYSTLHYVECQNLPIRVGFIHVPYLPEQVANTKRAGLLPSMTEETVVRALTVAIEAIGDRLSN
ncbi:pyroglutamyl-peptidase I [Methylotuvimicrobium alcaliphilum]|uniref:Pyroglutamyl-peptidase I n=1 Tax=Methylotuvimicrobium alcaliphilum (strain DSM 19304 / NCIMB 14124 / VKM B-2133 / 20Z) TaxID=1091494 RepID=G4T1C4_META2|nr:pyroglutamyl-peptidase I [Methylotuvimicrobium alcaliphilum]CCE25673.1 pyrrolidone-carboxylate peptidase [Methylotuvimicrobium alcaliphilum 20Z]